MSRLVIGVWVAMLACAGFVRAEEEEAVRVFANLRNCVVELKNAEVSGTGLMIDTKGTILTNAHIVTSPLPFTVKVEGAPSRAGHEPEQFVFHKVTIAGFHPSLDLALVRIDPEEQKALFQPAKLAPAKPRPGQRVYAIGNPGGAGMILSKTITSGMLSGERTIDGESFYQFSAAINPGNSGGPLVDKNGAVLGIVTFKLTDAEGMGFAIPLQKLNLAEFVPLARHPVDRARAQALLAEGDKYCNLADLLRKRSEPNNDRADALEYYAATLYREALSYDPNNPDTYYSVGLIFRSLKVNEPAAAYLLRAIELDPWHGDGRCYRELGLTFAYSKKDDLARAAWLEGAAKFPRYAKIWEDLTVYHLQHGNPMEAGYCAAVGLYLDDPMTRIPSLQAMHREALRKLPEAKHATLIQRETGISTMLEGAQSRSADAKKTGKKYVVPEFILALKELGISKG